MARALWGLLVGGIASCWGGGREPATAQQIAPAVGGELVVRDAVAVDELAVDPHHLYWLGGSDEQAGLWRADKRGQNVVRLARAVLPAGLALDDTSVYWGNGTEIFSMPKAGGEERLLARIPRREVIGGFAVYDDRIVAVTGDSDRDETSVWRFARPWEDLFITPITLAGDFEAVAGDPRGVYVATKKGLFFVDQAGFVKTLVRDLAVTALAVDKQHVYFSTRDRDPHVLRLPGSRAAPDVPKRLDSAKGHVVAMAAGPKFVYWGTHTDDDQPRAIYRIGKRKGWRERVAPIRDTGSFAVDETHIYWSDAGRGRIVRRRLDQ